MAGNTMTLGEILQSIHALEVQLQRFEERYRLRSEDFYRLVQEGRLEQSADFLEWLGLYEIKCKREQQYRRICPS
jgi:serine/threonine protein kinase HipA of HipAB toxin-antitoxin module